MVSSKHNSSFFPLVEMNSNMYIILIYVLDYFLKGYILFDFCEH